MSKRGSASLPQEAQKTSGQRNAGHTPANGSEAGQYDMRRVAVSLTRSAMPRCRPGAGRDTGNRRNTFGRTADVLEPWVAHT
jgi:hypothetical protein